MRHYNLGKHHEIRDYGPELFVFNSNYDRYQHPL